jgi:hypothetical protein
LAGGNLFLVANVSCLDYQGTTRWPVFKIPDSMFALGRAFDLRRIGKINMASNQLLTRLLKGRIVQSMEVSAAEISIGFFDGSIMKIKIMESNSPPLREQAQIRTIYEDQAKLLIECEDDSTFDVTLSEPGNAVSVRDKNNQVEYIG